MERLGQIPTVAAKIKSASSKAIKMMHILIFGNEGDKHNRKRLLEFPGFTFPAGSEELAAKMKQASQQLNVGDLVSICNMVAIDYSGTKQEVVSRICSGLADLNQLAREAENDYDEQDDDDEDDESNVQEEVQIDRKRIIEQQQIVLQPQHFTLSYKDVENTVRAFDGTDVYPVEHWINDFEDSAVLFGWSEIQKLVFAKRTLTGLAKLFIQSERGLNTWHELKEALRQEFHTKINSAQLHELLVSRRKKKNESVQEYYLTMKEIAAKGHIEAEALIRYVIDGITDDINHKLILSGAKTLPEFKEKLRSYDDTQKKMGQRSFDIHSRKGAKGKEIGSTGPTNAQQKKTADQKQTEAANKSSIVRCYNCGENGHRSKDCKSKSLGVKCFKCNQFGHIAADCNDNNNSKSVAVANKDASRDVNNIETFSGNKVYKVVKINNVSVNALIDTGCEVNLIREDVYKQINLPALKTTHISLRGFGNGEVTSLGRFETTIHVDEGELKLELYVVPSKAMSMSMIIGSNILEQAELILKRDEVVISKISRDVFLTQIEVIPELEVDFNHITDKSIKTEVAMLVTSYKPEKTKITEVTMNIVVKEERPTIYNRPHRLPLPEREIVEKQIEEWLNDGIIETCSSEFASAVLVVKKKTEIRECV